MCASHKNKINNVSQNIDRRLEELYQKTLSDIEAALILWRADKDKDRIDMVESAINRYYGKRAFITGYQSSPKYKMMLERKSRNKRLAKENHRLRLELSKKKWYQFW